MHLPETGGQPVTVAPIGRKSWRGRGLRREHWLGYLFVAPLFFFLFVVIFLPLVQAVYTSLFREAGVTVRFVGLGNYTQLLGNGPFWNSLKVTVTYAVAAVALHVLIGLPLALFLNRIRRGRTVMRLAFLTPWMVAPVIGAMMWVWLLDPHFGAVNYMLHSLGLIQQYQVWLGEPALAFWSVVLADVWRGFPFVMLILLAGLQTIPKEEYEASSLDGAAPLQQFRYITLPHLRYLLAVATTLDVINTVRAFDMIAVMTRGGPIHATEVLPVLIYNTAFQANHFGPAAAVGVVLLLLLVVFSSVYIYLLQPGRSSEENI
ncbi:MAG: sugar transporter permease [Firmicutes bacterium]|nr:sugar transporter permease [Bacillota bacterium]